MFTTKLEENFFLSKLKKSDDVLEWGSGSSTEEISKRVNKLLSIEHDLNWYNKVKSVKPQNCELIHIPTKYPHNHLIHGDGIYDNFEDYVNYPIGKSKFDVIFIDGRCRVECTSICHKISKPNTIVFVHDFMEYRIKNQNYDKMYDYLEKIESVETMCMFSVK
tara:strand:+ start:70 stop:558 length:489 start_codon:yes stop_codon:yes gene_type:complete